MNHSLKVHQRDTKISSQEIKQKLKKGMISGVVYGSHMDSTPIFIDPKGTDMRELDIGSKFDLSWSGKTLLATCKEIQKDILTNIPKHVSFHVTKRDATSVSKIPITIKGEAAGEKKGGVVVQMIKTVDLKGPAQSIPEALVIDVASLNINDKLMPNEIELPANVVWHEKEEFFDHPLVMCQPKQKAEEEDEAQAAEV